MSVYEIVCLCVCGLFCFFNCLCGFIRAAKTDKKITKLCEKCGVPVLEDEKHECPLSEEQLTALTVFLASLKGDKNG